MFRLAQCLRGSFLPSLLVSWQALRALARAVRLHLAVFFSGTSQVLPISKSSWKRVHSLTRG